LPRIPSVPGRFGVLSFRPPFVGALPHPPPPLACHCSSVGGLHCIVWHEQHHDHYRRLLARTRGCGRGAWGGGGDRRLVLLVPNTPRRQPSQPPTAMVGPQRSGAPVQCGWHATLVAPGRGVGSVQVSQYRVQEVGSRPEKPPAINTTHWRHTLRPACACCAADPRVGGRLLQLTTPRVPVQHHAQWQGQLSVAVEMGVVHSACAENRCVEVSRSRVGPPEPLQLGDLTSHPDTCITTPSTRYHLQVKQARLRWQAVHSRSQPRRRART
jgi:hypothetical protein